jgi:hypothetical protein
VTTEPLCAACAKPLEGTNWRWENGKGYHEGCKAGPPPEAQRKVRSLGAFAERKARSAMHGRGQRTLEDEDDG